MISNTKNKKNSQFLMSKWNQIQKIKNTNFDFKMICWIKKKNLIIYDNEKWF